MTTNNYNNHLEIIGITTCGTYPSWVDYTVASIYNQVDKIIVINSGYDIKNPDLGPYHRLEREYKTLKEMDIDNKILQFTPHTQPEEDTNLFNPSFRNKFYSLFVYGADELGRTSNITLSTMIANESFTTPKPHWILKLDSDQVFYKFKRKDLESLITNNPKVTGFRFAQYADYYHDFEHIGIALPDDFTNDGALFYKSKDNQRYGGQGSPDLETDQQKTYSLKTSHMRRITPPTVEKYEHFFKRYWYHTFGPNSIGELDYNHKSGKKLTSEEINKMAHNETISILRTEGRKISELDYDERIPLKPPLACKMTPLEYIKKDINLELI